MYVCTVDSSPADNIRESEMLSRCWGDLIIENVRNKIWSKKLTYSVWRLHARYCTSSLYLLSVKGSRPISTMFWIMKLRWPAWPAVVTSEKSSLSCTPFAVTQTLVTDPPAIHPIPAHHLDHVRHQGGHKDIREPGLVYLRDMSTWEGAFVNLRIKTRTETETSNAKIFTWSVSLCLGSVCEARSPG